MIERYVLVDQNGREEDYEYDSYEEAVEAATGRNCAVIERQYEYSDSELVWTPDGSTSWPNA